MVPPKYLNAYKNNSHGIRQICAILALALAFFFLSSRN